MQYILYPIAILVLLVVISYIIAFLQIYKSVFQYPKYKIDDGKQLPSYLKDLLKMAIPELAPMGFKPCCYLQVEPMLQNSSAMVNLLMYNKLLKTYAKVGIRYPLEAVNLLDIEFYTFFKDRSLLLTMNGRGDGVIGEMPNFTIQDAYTAETSVQWQLHQDTLEKLTFTKASSSLSPEKFADALQTHSENYLDYLFKAGKLRQIQETKCFRLNVKPAWKVARKLTEGANKNANILKHRQQAVKTNPALQIDIPVELEIEGFKRQENQRQGLVDGNFRAWMLLISFALFIASYMHIFEPHRLAIFVLVIMLHEAGHVVAMKLCGYRDTSMLFLPFLGAVATSQERYDTTLSQNIWVLLAGPLPGLILGIFLAVIFGGNRDIIWVKETAWMLIGLNLINLLPIYPLDGGKVANLLVFSRFVYSDVLFKLLGLFVLGCFAIRQPVLMVFLILIAFSIPQSFRAAKVNSKLQRLLKQNHPSGQDSLLDSIFKYLHQFGYHHLPASSKHSLVKDLIRRYNESRGKWTTRVSLIIFYCGSLLGGVTGSLYAISPTAITIFSQIPYMFENSQQRRERFHNIYKREIEKATVALQTNPNDINAYIKRAQARKVLRDNQGALADYNQIVRLVPSDTQHRLSRASLYSQLGDIKAEIQDYNYLLKLNPKFVRAYQKRAQAYTRLRNYKGAIGDYSQIIKMNPKASWNYIRRGYARVELKDYNGALVDATKAIELEPQIHDGYELRSKIRHRMGDSQGASADKQKVIALEQAWEETRED